MIKHRYLNNLTLNVPISINSTGKLHLDEDGCIVEELSFEQESELIEHPDFVTVESEKSKVKSEDPESDQEQDGKIADQEHGEGEKDENKSEDELKEFDTKIVNGKGFIYKKNKADVLMWLRHSEIDEKG